MSNIKDTFNALMFARGAKFTADVRAGKYPIPPVERWAGNQSRKFADGDKVRYVEDRGIPGVHTVIDGKRDNGYWNYALTNHRFVKQDDLTPARKE